MRAHTIAVFVTGAFFVSWWLFHRDTGTESSSSTCGPGRIGKAYRQGGYRGRFGDDRARECGGRASCARQSAWPGENR